MSTPDWVPPARPARPARPGTSRQFAKTLVSALVGAGVPDRVMDLLTCGLCRDVSVRWGHLPDVAWSFLRQVERAATGDGGRADSVDVMAFCEWADRLRSFCEWADRLRSSRETTGRAAAGIADSCEAAQLVFHSLYAPYFAQERQSNGQTCPAAALAWAARHSGLCLTRAHTFDRRLAARGLLSRFVRLFMPPDLDDGCGDWVADDDPRHPAVKWRSEAVRGLAAKWVETYVAGDEPADSGTLPILADALEEASDGYVEPWRLRFFREPEGVRGLAVPGMWPLWPEEPK